MYSHFSIQCRVQESQFKKPAKNLNFGIIDQSAALVIRFDSGGDFSVGNFSCLDLPVNVVNM